MIVTVVIAIIVGIVIPNLQAARISANEAAAVSTLKMFSVAQAQVITGGAIDSDNDGSGEYGFLQELSGVRNTRIDSTGDGIADSDGTDKLSPRAVSASLGAVLLRGRVQRSGYFFIMYLPGTLLQFRREPAPWGPYPGVSADEAANYWTCYAWPVSYRGTGRRAFLVNQSGQILACVNDKTHYSGIQGGPQRKAAIAPGEPNTMNARLAINTIGKDGNLWIVLQ
jgi:hypothetical protein